MTQMVVDETGDEEIAMVVTRLQTQGERVIGQLRCFLQHLRLELHGQKVIPITLIDQQGQTFALA